MKSKGRRATVRDVARLAGVSVGTVSHALNSTKAVSESARRAVLSAVDSLNYRPNSLARSLIAQRSRPSRPAHGNQPRLITVGYLSIDYTVTVDRVPETGERMTSRSIEKMLGGPAANVAAFAAGLGEPFSVRVEIVTHIGDDADSTWALEELAARDIDASGAYRQAGGRLSRCIVLVDEAGDRTIVNEPLQVPVELLTRYLSERGAAGVRSCVHFDGFHLGAAGKAHRALRDNGHLLSLHAAGLHRDLQTLDRCLDWIEMFDLLFLDRETFARIAASDPTGEVEGRPEALFSLAPNANCRAIMLTRGPEGAALLRPDAATLHISAPEVRVVDATGAGDAFAGVFLASWLSQGDLALATAHAVRGAARSLTALGAQGRLAKAGDVIGAGEVIGAGNVVAGVP